MRWRDAFKLSREAEEYQAAIDQAATFAVDADSIDPAVFGLTAYVTPTSPEPRIDRRGAMQVPAVKRARDLIAGTLGTLPVDLYSPSKERVPSPLFDQPEASVPRSVTMARTFEDLLFEGVAWWRVKEFSWTTYPSKVKRVDPRKVTVDEDRGIVQIDGKTVPNSELIRFDSPNDALLVAGARAIRTCLRLDSAAARYADEPMPLGYFSPTDGTDPADDETVADLLTDWHTARQSRVTGYVPAALKYNAVQFNAEQMQLAEQRQHAVLEIARMAGVDPEELGVSTTSRTYANQFDRRKAFIDMTLGGYMHAVEDRLSMGDVSPRGYYVRLNLDSFLRSDAKSRYEAYALGKAVGALTDEEIRAAEDRPVAQTRPSQPETNVEATDPVVVNFHEEPEHRLDAAGAGTFEVDAERRVIKGLAVPYATTATSNGITWQFSKGTLRFADVSRVKLWIQHDAKQAVGVATELVDTDQGLFAAFKIARGPEGDRALSLAEDGVLDGLSIGLGRGGRAQVRDGVHHAVEIPLMEISLTPAPAFDDARVHSVAASADNLKGTPMTETTDVVTEPGVDFSAITDALKAGFEGLQFPQREVVDATRELEVNEPSPYRFDGQSAQFSFVEDMRDAQQGNPEARQRLAEFGEEFAKFAVSATNVSSLNPTRNRPDLYVPQLQYSRPLWDSVSTGTVEDKTPFTVPKFSTATGLVGNHTEGTEPTPGAFTATVQTITPAPVSGKIEINREVLDQGGSPQADAIIWGEMLNAYYEAIEARIAAKLAAVGTAELNLASAVDAALVAALTNYFAGLQFVRGGNRFTRFVADGNLFPALVAAKDTAGRNLLPVLGPTNAQGSTDGAFDRVQLGNQTVRAAWALGTGNDKKSYNFVPSSVWAWASTPKKFVFEYQVKSVDMAIWGYGAEAVLRDSDVKPIDYTTADV